MLIQAIKTAMAKCFPISEQGLARKHAKKVLGARKRLTEMERKSAYLKSLIEFRVFHGVQGDQIEPDSIHGQSLTVHYGEWGQDDQFNWLNKALCSDRTGRWFMLYELSGKMSIERINAQRAEGYLLGFQGLKACANTVLPGEKDPVVMTQGTAM